MNWWKRYYEDKMAGNHVELDSYQLVLVPGAATRRRPFFENTLINP